VLENGIKLKIEKSQQEADAESGDVNFLNYFVIENSLLTDVQIEIDFTGSEDINIESKDEKDESTKLEVLVRGESTETIASVKSALHSSLMWQINW
jgi:hypothetical protein